MIIEEPLFTDLVAEASLRAKIMGVDTDENLALIGAGKAIMLSPPSCLHDYLESVIPETHQRELEEKLNILIWGYIDSPDYSDAVRNYLYVDEQNYNVIASERAALRQDGYCYTYTYNPDHPDCSDYDCIGIRKTHIGWVRTDCNV